NYMDKYKSWCNNEYFDENFREELKSLSEEEIEDSFYKDLSFGTAGLRGVIGAGSNRMNEYVVGKVTQGYANFLNKKFNEPSVAIAYDSRRMSKEFAQNAADVLSSNNIKVYLCDRIASTPELSFAIRQLKASGGIVVTASHNPAQYNGYKVYHQEGYQLLPADAESIVEEINKLDFIDVKNERNNNIINYLGEDFYNEYYETILKLIEDRNDKNLKIVYSALNGAGARPVVEVLKKAGFNNLYTVPEQMIPDSNFTTVPYPNPEDEKVFELSKVVGKENQADILIATDPDSDRVGVMSLHNGEYKTINGNQMGALLANYLLENEENQSIITTIVSSHLIDEIAKEYNAKVYKTLTGFKYIGELISSFDKTKDKFVLGFEESYGYLTSDHARDKDAVNTALIIAIMADDYKKNGKTLIDVLEEIYISNGYFKEELLSFTFEGSKGQQEMKELIDRFRSLDSFDYYGMNYTDKVDYLQDNTGLPDADVLKFIYEDQSWFAVRPSGTEPKLKIYLSVCGKDNEELNKKINLMKKLLNGFIGKI
ncbi:MAG: phospho-sugar mutase, partial [Clostridiales bacterium]|nr:phospho-sugar mutase [Clostridiales bacterium]